MINRTPGIGARGGQDRWLVSYADFVTLLLAFFTTLYAASKVDATKLPGPESTTESAVVAATPAAESAPATPAAAVGTPVEHAAAMDSATADTASQDSVQPDQRFTTLDAVRERLVRTLEDDIRLQRADIARDVRGLVISLPEQVSFAAGSAVATREALALIERIAGETRGLPNAIRIEGHTDDAPIRTAKYASNWELSTARAGAVVAFLVSTVGIEPARLSAAGYGEFHPRVPNDSPPNRARNRRIDIVILEDTAPVALAPAQAPEAAR